MVTSRARRPKSAKETLATVDAAPYFVKYGENVWVVVKSYLDSVMDRAAAPVIGKYAGVLAAADVEVFTTSTTFAIMQSSRLHRGPRDRSPVATTRRRRHASAPVWPRPKRTHR
jgi:hypothetical protein